MKSSQSSIVFRLPLGTLRTLLFYVISVPRSGWLVAQLPSSQTVRGHSHVDSELVWPTGVHNVRLFARLTEWSLCPYSNAQLGDQISSSWWEHKQMLVFELPHCSPQWGPATPQ